MRNGWILGMGTVFLSLTILTARAADGSVQSPETRFAAGQFESSIGGGALFSPVGGAHSSPTLDYSLAEAQIGYMLTDVRGAGFFRGNIELAGEIFGGDFFKGPGNYAIGLAFLGRYNFVQENSRFIPYLQVGAGGTSVEVLQRVEGENFNFNLDAGLGCRYFFTRSFSANAECRYQHISNADLSAHNIGINAVGPVISISYFF